MYTNYSESKIQIIDEKEKSVGIGYETTYTLEDGMQFIECDSRFPIDIKIISPEGEILYPNCRAMLSGGTKCIYQLNEQFVMAYIGKRHLSAISLDEEFVLEISILKQLNDWGFYTQDYELIHYSFKRSCHLDKPINILEYSPVLTGLKMEQFSYLACQKGMQVRDFKNARSSTGDTLIFGDKETFEEDSLHWYKILTPLIEDLKKLLIYGLKFTGDSKNSVIIDTDEPIKTTSRLITDRKQELHLYLFDLDSNLPSNPYHIYNKETQEFSSELIFQEAQNLKTYFYDLIMRSLLNNEEQKLFGFISIFPKSTAFDKAWSMLVTINLALDIKQKLDEAPVEIKLRHKGYTEENPKIEAEAHFLEKIGFFSKPEKLKQLDLVHKDNFECFSAGT